NGAFSRIAFFIIVADVLAGNLRYITFFKKDKPTGNRQERELIRGNKIFTATQTDDEGAAGSGNNQAGWIAAIHQYSTVSAFQLFYRALNGVQQRVGLFQFPVYQVGNNFGICV